MSMDSESIGGGLVSLVVGAFALAAFCSCVNGIQGLFNRHAQAVLVTTSRQAIVKCLDEGGLTKGCLIQVPLKENGFLDRSKPLIVTVGMPNPPAQVPLFGASVFYEPFRECGIEIQNPDGNYGQAFKKSVRKAFYSYINNDNNSCYNSSYLNLLPVYVPPFSPERAPLPQPSHTSRHPAA